MENQETAVKNPDIVLEASPIGYRAWYFTKEDHEKLINYLSGSVSFAGTSGKYFLDKAITFPRYKVRAAFEALNKRSVNKKSLAKNESYTDYIVLNTQFFLDLLNRMSLKMLYNKEVMYRDWYDNRSAISLQHLCSVYNSYKNIPIIDLRDFETGVNCIKDKMTLQDVESLSNLFESRDSASVKLGMEMLTNYDFDKSILPMIIICSKYRHIFRSNHFWGSTSFKCFRDTFYSRLTHSIDYLSVSKDSPDCYEHILKTKAVITESEYVYLRKEIYNSIISSSQDHNYAINLTEEDIKLEIPAENIVPDNSVITDLNNITNEIIMSGDIDETYDLIDDTTEDS